jgi:DNA-binding HxlR family transcriptional regulator
VVLVDDVVIASGAAISTASLIILAFFLVRYRTLVAESRRSSDLAKNLWDAMNARLTTQDARIVDLMARFEVLSVRQGAPARPAPAPRSVTPPPASPASQSITQPAIASQPVSRAPATPQAAPPSQRQSARTTNTTEVTILRSLVEGPKTPNAIREVIQVTREHNGRLLKGLFDRGLVVRNEEHKPYVYEITEAGRAYVSTA